jgi:formiminoglutamase
MTKPADRSDWLSVHQGDAPLIVSFPHTGTELPPGLEQRLVSPWLARKDADWWVDQLYAFAADLGATTVRTALSRTVIDVNRDPSGVSLYPGQATTGLCPVTTFDGEALYKGGAEPDAAEIADRRARFFDPYHHALAEQIARLQALHPAVVLYEAHSIRSRVSGLFDGVLPHFNIGTNDGAACAPLLTADIEAICDRDGAFSRVTNGRFKGGWTTRHYGRPDLGVHSVQMELACRGYMREPPGAFEPANWPAPFEPTLAAPLRARLTDILKTCIAFAETR